MPWSKNNVPDAASKLKGKRLEIFVSAANSALREHNDEGKAIATGLAAAKRYKEKSMNEDIDKALTENIKARLHSALNEMLNDQGALYVIDYDSSAQLVYFDLWLQDEGNTTYRTSYSIQDGELVVSDNFSEVIRTSNYVEKATNKEESKDSTTLDKIYNWLEKHFGGSSQEHTEVIKAFDEELKQATHIVYQPNVPDLHGEYMSEETIRRACHSFNSHCRKANLFHKVETDQIEIVESYILPVNAQLGDIDVKKGTWIAVLQYKDDELWKMEKSGEIQGISIGARGKREQ